MKFTILDFTKKFPDNDTCLEYLFRQRFGDNTVCSKCGVVDGWHKQKNSSKYVCQCGGSQLSPKAGTIFEKSSTDLVKWFFAIFLFAQSRNGVAAKELQRELGVTYKCAWRMASEIRKLMKDNPKLSGIVEADETRIGGKGNMDDRKKKAIVFGAVERKGKIATRVIEDATEQSLLVPIQENVAKGSNCSRTTGERTRALQASTATNMTR